MRNASASTNGTRDDIVDAALRCFSRFGMAKTSIKDVAEAAGVSRGTVYRYFPEREDLIRAAIEHGAMAYYERARAAIERHDTLASQVAAFAEVLATSLTASHTRERLAHGDIALAQLMTRDAGQAVLRTVNFLEPYVKAAQDRGEVRADVNARRAAEWLARILLSFSAMPAVVTVDVERPKQLRRFVQAFAVDGLG